MTIGQKIICLDSVDSTNNYVANLVNKKEIDHGTVIMAEDQYAGKGQRGSEWLVKPGENLTFSTLIDNVNLSVSDQFFITQFISIILIQTFERLGIKAMIKWPNDIYVNNKKIAGVLIENQLSGSMIKSSIIGIGININQKAFDCFTATSTILELNSYMAPKDVLMVFIDVFNSRLPEFSRLNNQNLKSEYLKNLYKKGEQAVYRDLNGLFEARIRSVLDSGHLVLIRDGKDVVFDLKEITFEQ